MSFSRPMKWFPRKEEKPKPVNIAYVPPVEYPLHHVDPIEIDPQRDRFLTELLAKRKERE